MNSVIIFDVSGDNNPTQRVVAGMAARGYVKNWQSNNQTFFLPHNIVWKPNTEFRQAYDDLQQVIQQLNFQNPPITIRRCVILNSSPWMAINGAPIQ